jgi:hypothetical protein
VDRTQFATLDEALNGSRVDPKEARGLGRRQECGDITRRRREAIAQRF